MARRSHFLKGAVFLALALLSRAGIAQDQPAKQASAEEKREAKAEARHAATMSPEFENIRKALEALTPEQRARFQQNFTKWANLSPEEKKALRDREEMRRKKIAEEIDNAIREAGLNLDKEHRTQFVKRYAEERRKVEEQLRKEMEEKRQPMLKEIQKRLKEEFSAPALTAQPAPATNTTR